MTREEYILQQLGLAKDYINSATTTAGKRSDWDKSWAPDSIFPQIYDGMLSQAFGQIYDQSAQISALAMRLEDYKSKINEIIMSYDELLLNINRQYPSWGILTVDRMP